MTFRNARRTLLSLIALALLALAPATASAAERTVSAGGEATLRVANDSASVGLAVSRERRSRGAALRAASAGLRKVIAAARTIPGVGPADIVTGRVSVSTVHRGKRVVYRAGEGVQVTLHEPKRAGDLIGAAIAAGASDVSGPRFFVGDTDAAFAKALTKAFDAAKTKASALAAQSGGSLGAAITIDEGSGPEIFFAGSGEGKTSPSDQPASAPTKPGRSQVTATVHVVFELR